SMATSLRASYAVNLLLLGGVACVGESSTLDPGAHESEPAIIFQAEATFVALFPRPDGVVVVDSAAAHFLDRSGNEVATFAPGRTITAAAGDGTYLAVADQITLTVLDWSLAQVREAPLERPCSSGVVLSQHRLICRGGLGFGTRGFTVYDLVTASSLGEAEGGGTSPLRAVPGTDMFMTVGGFAPEFSLFELELGTSLPRLVTVSNVHHEHLASHVFAFDGTPARHLINATGEILLIRGPDCPANSGADCFVPGGGLGFVPDPPFIAMTDNGAGAVFTLRSASQARICMPEAPCALETVDVASRAVTQRIEYAQQVLWVGQLAYDPDGHQLVLADLEPNGSAILPSARYAVHTIPLAQ
ncbi:MAG: hypothetical protein KC933_31470, partial [Myxococcales bacterium]|nr:hypothetical protein [Myxococcales bacterium]